MLWVPMLYFREAKRKLQMQPQQLSESLRFERLVWSILFRLEPEQRSMLAD